MSEIHPTSDSIHPMLPYLVYYVTAASAEEFEDITRQLQEYQDAMAVKATCEQQAVQLAHHLLEERCEFEFIITKVMGQDELQSAFKLLGRVAVGELPAASLADRDHLVWADRYVYGEGESSLDDVSF